MVSGCVISDLHFLSKRSVYSKHREAIAEAVAQSDVVVLNGDIFDFRWSQQSDPSDAVIAANDWLRQLVLANPQARFHYICGNHDSSPAFSAVLEKMQSAEPRFFWHPYCCQLGSNVFLHGDIIHTETISELDRYRQQFHRESSLLKRFEPLYQLLHHLRVPQLVSRMHSKERMIETLERVITAGVLPVLSPVTDVYFGHTHHPFEGFERNGTRYHNTGAVVAGMRWKILRFQIAEKV